MFWYKLSFRNFIVSLLFLGLIGCAPRFKNLDTPEGTMAEAESLMEDKFYEEARRQFFRIKTEFPTSPFQAEADLRIADSYFAERSYQVAATSYEDFVRLYPGHEKIPYALYRMGMAYVNQMPSNPQRDTRGTQKAADTFTRLIIDFPESEYVDEAIERIDSAQDQLALKVYRIARFYEKKRNFGSAARRYGELADLYADHSLAEESLARQVRMLRRAGENDRADDLSRNFQQRYPSSKFMYMLQP